MSGDRQNNGEKIDALAEAARLLAEARTASLSTSLARDGSGWPYGSFVLIATHHRLGPLLLLSDLADHSRNLKADHRAALLLTSAPGKGDPLAASRITLLGRMRHLEDADIGEARSHFLATHPEAARYAGFADFRLYRLVIERAHLVAGFGRISWLDPIDLVHAGIIAGTKEDPTPT